MKYQVNRTAQFKREYRLALRRGQNIAELDDIIVRLAKEETLPEKNRDHSLSGPFRGYRECHISPDWLLIYRIHENRLILVLSRTGSHSDLF